MPIDVLKGGDDRQGQALDRFGRGLAGSCTQEDLGYGLLYVAPQQLLMSGRAAPEGQLHAHSSQEAKALHSPANPPKGPIVGCPLVLEPNSFMGSMLDDTVALERRHLEEGQHPGKRVLLSASNEGNTVTDGKARPMNQRAA